jgi:hypothetical protein
MSNENSMPRALPHEGVLVRLGVSQIHGIGVFAQQAIRAGTNVFANDQRAIRLIARAPLDDLGLEAFQRSFYDDFCIRRGDVLGCPSNFNLLTVGWYVNEPRAGEEPNLAPSSEFDLIAARDIRAGDELTISYASFGQATAFATPHDRK